MLLLSLTIYLIASSKCMVMYEGFDSGSLITTYFSLSERIVSCEMVP